MTVRIGLGLFTGQLPAGSGRTFAEEYRDVVELARLAETLGFDSVWVSEHHGSSDGYLPSLLPLLGGLATATDRVLLGTGVILTPFHYPLRLAEDAAVVDQLSGGRLILGLGLAWREEEFRMFDVPLGQRVRRTTETVDILRKAWTGQRFSHDGRVFSFDRVKVTPPPVRDEGPPIYLGGFVEDAVRRAGRVGDGYIRSRGGLNSAKEALVWFEDGARQAGRDPDRLGWAQLQNAFVWEDGDAWEVVRPGAAHQLGVYEGWRVGTDTPEREELEVIPPDEETLRKLTPAGDRHEVIRALRPLVDAFATRDEFHLVVRLHYPGMDLATAGRSVELFGEAVLPALKGA
ncbi:MAG TPA: LLM class flavin-dependent oxidoreductase [Actinomycetota bacterium]|nr:LLM class flavin-dependent oxidoreductase [Actinomycetota bacterium]